MLRNRLRNRPHLLLSEYGDCCLHIHPCIASLATVPMRRTLDFCSEERTEIVTLFTSFVLSSPSLSLCLSPPTQCLVLLRQWIPAPWGRLPPTCDLGVHEISVFKADLLFNFKLPQLIPVHRGNLFSSLLKNSYTSLHCSAFLPKCRGLRLHSNFRTQSVEAQEAAATCNHLASGDWTTQNVKWLGFFDHYYLLLWSGPSGERSSLIICILYYDVA